MAQALEPEGHPPTGLQNTCWAVVQYAEQLWFATRRSTADKLLKKERDFVVAELFFSDRVGGFVLGPLGRLAGACCACWAFVRLACCPS